MIAALHSLSRAKNHKLLDARLGQYLKAIEQSVLARGSWQMAWLLTGLPEPRPQGHVNQGLAHPAEFAAGVAFMRETRVLEEAVRGRPPPAASGGPSPAAGGSRADKEPWWVKRKREKEDKQCQQRQQQQQTQEQSGGSGGLNPD